MSSHELPKQIQHLLQQRDQHLHAVNHIDQMLSGVISVLSGNLVAPAAKATVKHAGLTPRERQTLRHLLSGRPEKTIAKLMRLSTGSVHIYTRNVFRKFGVNSRAKLMALFLGEVAKTI